jgi:hypothetical protein
MMSDLVPDPEILRKIVETPMPFGRYQGTIIADLPVSYLEWFKRKGFPEGKLGVWLETMYVIQLNGLEFLLKPLRPNRKKDF